MYYLSFNIYVFVALLGRAYSLKIEAHSNWFIILICLRNSLAIMKLDAVLQQELHMLVSLGINFIEVFSCQRAPLAHVGETNENT